jgi:eukaryotic-like serine/threonine-protein kinase
MGEVYRARDPRLGREVAIKVLPAGLSADPERLRRFEQEARAAAALNHSNILAVHDVGQHDGSPYIVAELLDGDTLRERLTTGPLPVRKAVEYAVQLAHGLAAAHEKGITHRDLKPENIFITSDGRVKILDFGLAKLTQPEVAVAGVSALPTTPANTAAGIVLGTAGYMSPEQMRGLPADQRSDIFAFGAVLYEMLSGVRAFRGDSYADTISAILKENPLDLPVADRHIPPALVRIVDRCLEKSPSVRFQSAGDLGFALEGLSLQAEAIPISRPAWAGIGRERIAWTLFGVALVAALVLGALTYVGRAPSDTQILKATILPPPGAVITERSVAQGSRPTAGVSHSRPPGATVSSGSGCGASTPSPRSSSMALKARSIHSGRPTANGLRSSPKGPAGGARG